jgi:hypothetical protein
MLHSRTFGIFGVPQLDFIRTVGFTVDEAVVAGDFDVVLHCSIRLLIDIPVDSSMDVKIGNSQ